MLFLTFIMAKETTGTGCKMGKKRSSEPANSYKDLFAVTDKESALIMAIVDRVVKNGAKIDPTEMCMCLAAAHCNGCKLRLQDMLDGDLFDIYHDIFGIHGNINRRTGKIEGLFCPRFSRGKSTRKGNKNNE